MKHPDDRLGMPLYVKADPDMDWPDHTSFYLLTGSGLFLCRNHPFFRSCVPAPRWPADLQPQGPALTLRYPKIPTAEFERIVGFFSRIAELHGSEAAVLLLWDSRAGEVVTHVPAQSAGVSDGFDGYRYPLDVRYAQPLDLPPHLTVIGDVHSHVDEAAYASSTDRKDEQHRAGLHIVVGRISREPPDLHCEVVVDGTRFSVSSASVVEGYEKRSSDFPVEWVDRVLVEVNRPYYSGGWDSRGSGNGRETEPAEVDYETYASKRRKKRWS